LRRKKSKDVIPEIRGKGDNPFTLGYLKLKKWGCLILSVVMTIIMIEIMMMNGCNVAVE